MKNKLTQLCLVLLGLFSSQSVAQNVLFFHGQPRHNGNYVVPTLTPDRAKLLTLDNNFHPPKFETGTTLSHINAQPLYWTPPGSSSAMLLIVTEDNNVYAIDASSGSLIWQRSLGEPVPLSALPCGNIKPFGVTGTPVIDAASQAIYLNAPVDIGVSSGPVIPSHRAFALSLTDGSILPGWPVDIGTALPNFIARDQNQRGALALLNGTLYIPFGGHDGDCGQYHGVVVGISLANQSVSAWSTRAKGGGIWAAGGITSDGTFLYTTTGNTMGANVWSDGEAVIRLYPDLHHSLLTSDDFAPTNWSGNDATDADLGSSNPLPFDLPLPTTPSATDRDDNGRAVKSNCLGCGCIGG